MKNRSMGKVIACAVCLIMAITALPAAWAGERGQVSSMPEEDTYAPGEVIVLFKDGAVEDRNMSLSGARSLQDVGSNFGMSLNASGDADEAADDAKSETEILRESLGDGFILEDSISFPAVDEAGNEGASESRSGLKLDSDDSSEDSGELNIALVSSDRYDTETLIRKLSDNSGIAAAEPNYYIYDEEYEDYALNDPFASYLYQANSPLAKNTAGDSVDGRGEMPEDPEDSVSTNAASAWKQLDASEQEVVVAVVDTGVNPEHEDLKSMLWTNPGDIGLKGEHGYNFGDDNTDIRDHNGHGTHCCGIIAAEANNGKGIAGVASGANVKIMMLKKNADDSENSKLYVAMGAFSYAIRAKEAGVNVVATSNSWGRDDSESTIFNEIIDRMGEAGILTFCAAGNATKNLDRSVDNPASNGSEYSIKVGCAGIDGEPAGFSNYGKSQVSIFSPGLNILSSIGYTTYFPSLYSEKELSRTTAYYGGFDKDTEINEDGSVTPGKGKGGDDVNAFGASVFRVQKNEEYEFDDLEDEDPDDFEDLDNEDDPEEDEDPDDDDDEESNASCELSIEPAHYFTMGKNAASLKVTIKNAVLGEDYFLYFPYEKDPETEGEENTWFSIYYENGDTEDASACDVYGGDVVEDEDGTVEMYECGYNGYATTRANRYMGSHLGTSGKSKDKMNKLVPYDELDGCKVGLGIQVSPTTDIDGADSWQDGEPHDIVIYLDHIAVSRPDVKIDPNSSYEMMSGTSMACPAAAGAGALVAALYPREEGQSGSDYTLMIKDKYLSCAHKTDALKDKCSTGGYIDLSLLETGQPVIRDAVCDLEKDTITLKGSGLLSGNRLTYRRVYQEDAEEVQIPEAGDQSEASAGGMTAEFAGDGSEAVIHNARALFGTYTEFMYSDRCRSGQATFFLVKGHKKIRMAASRLEPNPTESDFEENKEPDRYLMADADGKQLYGIEKNKGTISKFDGEQFVNIPGTRIKDAVEALFLEKGYDRYQVTGEFDINTNIDMKPWHYGDMVYAPVYVTYEPGPEDTGMENDQPGETDDDDDDDEDESMEWEFLASLDLSKKKPSWQFEQFTEPDEPVLFYYQMVGNKLYAFGSEDDEDCSMLLSYDLSAAENKRKWKREQDLPAVVRSPSMASYRGKLYLFFGAKAPETGKHEDEMLSDDVWCFDGSEWKKTGTLAFAGKYTAVHGQDPEFMKYPVETGNGLVFVDCSVDGLGNTFLYDPETDEGTPLYYTINDSISDDTVYGAGSCAVTRDGICYMRDHSDEMRRGWAVYMIPESDGAYESPYRDWVKPENGLPVVYLTIDETKGTIDAMNSDEKHKTYCYGTFSIDVPEVEGGFRYSDEPDRVIEGLSGQEMEIRGRGNTTWSGSKKPYKVKLSKKTDIFGLGKNRHWVLIANGYDETLVKDRMTAWLGEAIGLEFTPRGFPVDLVMRNTDGTYDKYLGSYYLSENVRVDDTRVNIDELTESDTDEQTITGGYLIHDGTQEDPKSLNQMPTAHAEWAAYTPDFDEYEGAVEDNEQKEYIKGFLQDIEDAIYRGDFAKEDGRSAGASGEAGGKYVSDMMDYRSAALYWLVDQMSKNNDGYNTGSTYAYKTRDTDDAPGKLFWGPLWDFDFAWRYGGEEIAGFEIKHDWIGGMFTDKGEGGFVDEVKREWPAVKSALDELTRDGGIIDGYYEETKKSQAADVIVNPRRIPDEPDEDYELEVYEYADLIKELKEMIQARAAWIDAHIDEVDNLVHTVVYVVNGEIYGKYYNQDGVTLDGACFYPEVEGKVFVGWEDENGKLIDPEMCVTCDMMLTARYIPEDEATHADEIYFRKYKGAVKYDGVGSAAYNIPYSVYPEDAQDKRLVWSTSDGNIATVDEELGSIYLKAAGKVTITATLKYTGISRMFDLTVTEDDIPYPESVEADKKQFDLSVGGREQITLTTAPELAQSDYIEYEPEDESIVEVDDCGVITALRSGETNVNVAIYVYPEDGSESICVKTSVKVKVSETARKANTLRVSGKKVTLKRAVLAKGNVTIKRSKAIKVTGAKGTVVYRKLGVTRKAASGKYTKAAKKLAAKFTIDRKTGRITVKKGVKKGTYRLKAHVTAAGNRSYKSGTKTTAVTIKVR